MCTPHRIALSRDWRNTFRLSPSLFAPLAQLPVDIATRARQAGSSAAQDAQRHDKVMQAKANTKSPANAPATVAKPDVIRSGSLVKLASADKKFDGQVGRVIDTDVRFAHTTQGLISVLLAPKGKAQGMWVAVPPESLTVCS